MAKRAYQASISAGSKHFVMGSIVAVALLEAACQGTIHDRWTQESDSVEAWRPRLARIPIDVHGSTYRENVDRVQIGLASEEVPVDSTPRIELYVGGNTLPINETYCEATPTLRSVKVSAGRVMVAAALCDGHRLVVTARQELRPNAVSDAYMGGTIKEIKYRLIYAISMSRSQVPTVGSGDS